MIILLIRDCVQLWNKGVYKRNFCYFFILRHLLQRSSLEYITLLFISHFYHSELDMTQFTNCAVSSSFHSHMFDFPWLTEYLIFSFSILLSSLIKSFLFNFRNLCLRSRQGNENREIKALETRSAFQRNN